MATDQAGNASSLPDFLKPFHERASQAEERLAKLEAALNSSTSTMPVEQNELLGSLVELREKMEKARAEQVAEREQAQREQERLAAENAKLQYRISHLIKALKEADEKLEKKL